MAEYVEEIKQPRFCATREKVRLIPVDWIRDFPDHPFLVKEDEDMKLLIESIRNNGILNPIIVRKIDEKDYEIISGHRRKYACKKAGYILIPVIAREVSRDDAIIEMVDSNLQREHILPSEKAKAYKMKMEAMRRSAGRPSNENPRPLVGDFETADVIGETSGDSGRQVQRYIRLNELAPELLAMVDNDKIAFRPAVELSYLQEQEQRDLLETIESEDATPSLAQAIRMKELSREGKLDMDQIFSIMTEEKANQKEKIKIPMERLEKYFHRGTPPREIEETIVKALEYYNAARAKRRSDREDR